MSLLNEITEKKLTLKQTRTIITYPDGHCYVESRSSTLPEESIKKPYGYVVDNKPDDKPAKILTYLYFGSQDCCSREVIEKYSIVNILSIGIEAPCRCGEVTYHFLECLDLPETNIWEIVKKSVVVIENSVNNCENILVHCNAGVSRSASVIIGYLIYKHNFQFVNALEYVKSVHPSIQPNVGFLKQLEEHHLYI
ncbi:hypothetical protein WA026_008389 [Henosepilachna vigintioctopunctata]|uniref:Dual specificity protein phosphatase n=1 Tax=Henosepilachna vigintioctopunctata TaxID=420089 RepID=A0AAW1UAD0_9CUCU